ncbi:MAG: creatininase family protein [Planctomycetes bacterium]|nr:creatininase family protein [Planctomycetota bacterium]
MPDKRVILHDLTQKEYAEWLESGDLIGALVPVGSVENHYEHLALIHDTASAAHIAREAALRVYPHVVVTTPVVVGLSPSWKDMRGTLTLREDILTEVVFDYCDSVVTHHGLKNVLIINGHLGNHPPIAERMDEFREKLNANIDIVTYWDLADKEKTESIMETKRYPAHAQEYETSIAMAGFPEHVRYDAIVNEQAIPSSAEKGKVFIDDAVEGIVAILRGWIDG